MSATGSRPACGRGYRSRPAFGRLHVLGRRSAPDLSWFRVLLVPMLLASRLPGQVRPELRTEFVTAADDRVEVGGGFRFRISNYVRANATTAYDIWSSSDSAMAQWRGEGSVRFLLDPLAERRWGLSFGAGAGYRERAYLLVLVDLEGPAKAGLRPAMTLGVGGGLRAAIVLRTFASPDRR